ncbi:MAG: hypothetical protein QMC89_01545 [Candidatus Hodarchaeaceae archaeon]|nr:hypothetical protein [Candidatus Hodarchaeaceae archaeon]
MKPERISLMSVIFFALLGIVLVVVGASALDESIYAGTIYAVIGAAQVLISVLTFAFTRGKIKREFGNTMVLGCWWILSVGIAGLALFTSPLFAISPVYSVVSSLFAVIWVVLGAFNMWLMVSKVGAEIVV